METIFRFLRGFVRIKVYGTNVERFMNLCARAGIELRHVERTDSEYFMDISLKAYMNLKPILKKANVKASVLKKSGLPFLIILAKKRIYFTLGAIFCVAFLLLMKNYIWAIQTEGNTFITKDIILDFLAENNCSYGTPIRSIDYDSLEKLFRKEFDEVTWVSIGVEGTKLHICMKESDAGQFESHSDTMNCSNLCAAKDGIVESIITRNGIPMVKPGDVVKKGDVLITGQIPVYASDGTIRENLLVNADGDITIFYEESYYDFISIDYMTRQYTGNEKKELYIGLFQNEYRCKLSYKEFESYDTVTKYSQIKLMDNFYLPFRFAVKTNREYNVISQKYTSEEMEACLKEKFHLFIESLEEKGVQNIKKDVKIYNGGDYMCLSGKVVLLGSAVKKLQIILPAEMETENGEYSTTDDGNVNGTYAEHLW